MYYKPYSQEWHRFRNLRESLDAYLDEKIDPQDIVTDILSVLEERSSVALASYEQAEELKNLLTDQ